jgi:hypothetical protein
MRDAVFTQLIVPSVDALIDALTLEWSSDVAAASAVASGAGAGAAPAPTSDVGIAVLVQHGLPADAAENLKATFRFEASRCLVDLLFVLAGCDGSAAELSR